jgi:hypothetical protein
MADDVNRRRAAARGIITAPFPGNRQCESTFMENAFPAASLKPPGGR